MPKSSKTFNLELSLEAWLVVHLLIGLFQKLVLFLYDHYTRTQEHICTYQIKNSYTSLHGIMTLSTDSLLLQHVIL